MRTRGQRRGRAEGDPVQRHGRAEDQRTRRAAAQADTLPAGRDQETARVDAHAAPYHPRPPGGHEVEEAQGH